MASSTAEWKGGMAFDLELQGWHFDVDADGSVGGKGLGPQPKGLMLSSLAGCTGMDVVSILGKMKVPFTSFKLDIEAVTSDSHPKVFTEILIKYLFEGDENSLDEKKILRSIDLSLNDYCGVANTLKHTAKIRFELYLNGVKRSEGAQNS